MSWDYDGRCGLYQQNQDLESRDPLNRTLLHPRHLQTKPTLNLPTHTTTKTNSFYGHFSRSTRLSQYQNNQPFWIYTCLPPPHPAVGTAQHFQPLCRKSWSTYPSRADPIPKSSTLHAYEKKKNESAKMAACTVPDIPKIYEICVKMCTTWFCKQNDTTVPSVRANSV